MTDLALGDVHLWRFPLDPPDSESKDLNSYLTADEKERAAKYVFQSDREKFTAARGYLRAILAQYIDCKPAKVRFSYGDHGKPNLHHSHLPTELRFNLSHSSGLGLCAVALSRELGVDIERIRPEVDIQDVARSSFSSAEYRCLQEIELHHRLTAFFDCWTRKEAYIKARGDGLAYPLDAFDVEFRPGKLATLLRSAEGQSELSRWLFQPLPFDDGYSATLVVELPVTQIRIFG